MGSFADHVLAELPGSELSVIDKLTEFFARGRPVKLTSGPPTDAAYVNTPGDGAVAFDIVGGHLYVRNGVDTWVDIGPGGGGGGGAPTDATYLVATAHAGLSAEIPVGATPNGELGGTWGAITVDATHSGSSHAGIIATHEAAGDPHSGYALDGDLTTHAGAADPHTGYQKESEKGNANGYASLDGAGTIPDAQIPAAIARDSELHAQNHSDTQHTDGPNSKPGHQHSHDSDLTGVSADDHHAQAHVLATGTALGGDHSISGAAVGEVLRALSGTTAAFDQLGHGDLGGVSADQHHAQSHTHASHTGIGANDHHNESHSINSHTSFIISRGGTVVKSDGVAAINVIVWRAPYACTVTNVRGYRVGGTGATINARRNGTDNHLSSALSLTSADTWMDGGAVQNTAYAAGDKMEIMVVSASGTPTQIAIQVDLTRP